MSSSLMIALGSLGGVVLAGVVAQGAWAARKAGPKRATTAPVADPREPVMGEIAPPGGAGDAPDLATLAELPPDGERRRSKRLVHRVDALIDAVATLRVDAPVAGAMVVPHLPATRRAGGKPFMIEGLDAERGAWETPTSAGRYGEFQAGLQLANRTGALNEIEYSEFVQKMQNFAEGIGAMAEFPDMLDAVAAARELDQFASEHDAQLAVHIASRAAPWSIGYIQQNASRHGFVPGVVAGRLVMPAAEEGAPPILTLTFDPQAALADDPNQSTVRDLILAFDVPQTESKVEPFALWQAAAQGLALDMDAVVVDDHGRPLGPESFAGIGGQLVQLYEQLAARDLAAGSATARRLFS